MQLCHSLDKKLIAARHMALCCMARGTKIKDDDDKC